jgi:hypothetical protein
MLSYGGVNLMHDTSALAGADAVLSLMDLRDFGRRVHPGRLGALGSPWLEFETRPTINRLVWPTGASRWATGWFLTDDAGLAILRPQAYTGNTLTPLPFVMDDGQLSITTSMYLLPPRSLAQNGEGGDLYLITLVDQRYFWWEKAASIAVTAGTTTWSQLFAAIGTALGVSIALDSVPAAYLKPPADFNTYYELLPPQLDAAAAAVGMKVVVALDGSVRVLTPASAQTQFNANDALSAAFMAGGFLNLATGAASDLGGVLPASVTVAFPVVDAGGNATGASSAVATTLAAASLAQYAGAATFPGTHLLRSTLGAGPSNSAQVNALALQMAQDYYAWRQAWPDIVYVGAFDWIPSGVEDRIEWSHSGDVIATRVQRPPWNDRVETGPPDVDDDDAEVRVTASTPHSNGYYSGVISTPTLVNGAWDGTSWTDGAVVSIRERNGGVLTVNQRYEAESVGLDPADGTTPAYVTDEEIQIARPTGGMDGPSGLKEYAVQVFNPTTFVASDGPLIWVKNANG